MRSYTGVSPLLLFMIYQETVEQIENIDDELKYFILDLQRIFFIE